MSPTTTATTREPTIEYPRPVQPPRRHGRPWSLERQPGHDAEPEDAQRDPEPEPAGPADRCRTGEQDEQEDQHQAAGDRGDLAGREPGRPEPPGGREQL